MAATLLTAKPAPALTETLQWIPAGTEPDTPRTVLVLAVSGGDRFCGSGWFDGVWRDATGFAWGDGEVQYWAEIPRGPAC